MASNPFQDRFLQIAMQSPYLQSVLKPGRTVTNIEYYAYNVTVGSVAAPLANGIPQTATFDTQSDSDFAIAFLSAAVTETVNGVVVYNDNVALQIQDTSTGKFFFNTDTVIGLVTGAGGFPFVLPASRVINPNTTIAVRATNRDAFVNGGAGPVGVTLVMHGSRIFYAN